MTRPAPSMLTTRDYDRVFTVLDECGQVDDLASFKLRLMDSLHEHFHFPNTTFLQGVTFINAFSDPDPVITGRISPIIDEYQDRWYTQDVFASVQARRSLLKRPALDHASLSGIPSRSVHYLENFLYRKGLTSAAVLHLDLPQQTHALVGIFDGENRSPSSPTMYALSLLARQLSHISKALPGGIEHSARDRLTPRQREIAELITDGLTNEEIARALVIELDTVKKYVSRTFATVGVRNRAELVKLMLVGEAHRVDPGRGDSRGSQ